MSPTNPGFAHPGSSLLTSLVTVDQSQKARTKIAR
jgi:hypothetical protein